VISDENAQHILMLENRELRRLMKKLSDSLSYLIDKKLSSSTGRKSPLIIRHSQTYDTLLMERQA
jgi:hypothetical protein